MFKLVVALAVVCAVCAEDMMAPQMVQMKDGRMFYGMKSDLTAFEKMHEENGFRTNGIDKETLSELFTSVSKYLVGKGYGNLKVPLNVFGVKAQSEFNAVGQRLNGLFSPVQKLGQFEQIVGYVITSDHQNTFAWKGTVDIANEAVDGELSLEGMEHVYLVNLIYDTKTKNWAPATVQTVGVFGRHTEGEQDLDQFVGSAAELHLKVAFEYLRLMTRYGVRQAVVETNSMTMSPLIKL